MMEEIRRCSSGRFETLIVTENCSEGSKPSIAEMVRFIESLAAADTPLEMTEESSGSMRLSMLEITENSRSKPDFRVETNSSATPPPSTPEIRQLKTVGEAERFLVVVAGSNGRRRRWRERKGGG